MDIVEALRNDEKSIVLNGHICLVNHEAADEIERLRNKVQWLELVENTVVKQDKKIERLREALQKIADGDVERESVIKWRTDGQYSKNDRCKHHRYMYEECAECLQDFARSALKEIE